MLCLLNIFSFHALFTGRLMADLLDNRRVSMLSLVDCSEDLVDSSNEADELARG